MYEHPQYTKIWRTVQLIPLGKVASYAQIADLAGLPGRARLVGKSLGYVPKDMGVPWHRVLRFNGQIAFPTGSEQSQRQTGLLQQEDVAVFNSRVKLSLFQWQPDLAEMLCKLEY
ncbi:MAG: methylated-DNA-protein-cysteine methyltransferase-like protein [Paraglaciecola sp.]|jgi:methylated-DNA-protein-cysteine methyltransferase-like protein